LRKLIRYYKLYQTTPKTILLMNMFFRVFFRFHARISAPINYTSFIGNPEKLVYHNDKNTLVSLFTSGHCYIQCINGVEFGRNILFAPGIKIISANHTQGNLQSWDKELSIKIGDNVWLGANVIILPGVSIADNCVVGAGSVVTKSILEPSSIVVGNPARILEK